MFNHTFYHGLMRKYSSVFGTLFNEIYVNRWNADGSVAQSIKVPLTYSPKEKVLARIKADPELNLPVATVLPRMAFEIINISYDPARKLSTTQKIQSPRTGDDNSVNYVYREVPYNIDFQLYIMVNKIQDGNQIVEQILPYFTPAWTPTVELLDSPSIVRDLPIVLQGVTMDDQYEGNFDERRALIFTLTFSMKASFFGPVRTTGIIKFANVNLYDATLFVDADDAVGNTTYVERVTVQPAMLANGSPTTNAAASVPISQIGANDNFDYAVTITQNLT